MKNTNNEYFLTIIEEGSLSKAAQKLYLSQPSLSQYVKRMEKRLGVELFDHNSSPLKLTYSGERYYEFLLEEQKNEKEILQELKDIKLGNSGRIRLGIAFWRAACFLPEVYPEFNRQYPNIKIDLFEGKSVNFQKELLNGHIDFAVCNIGKDMNYNKFSIEILKNEQILIGAPTNHSYVKSILKNQKNLNGYPKAPLDIFNQLPLILSKDGQNLTYQIQEFFAAKNIEPNILVRTENLTTAINLSVAGMGCVFVPEEGAHVCHRNGEITYFTLDEPELYWKFAVIYRKNEKLSRVCRLFIDFTKQIIK